MWDRSSHMPVVDCGSGYEMRFGCVVSVRQAKPLAAATEWREPHERVAPSFFIQ